MRLRVRERIRQLWERLRGLAATTSATPPPQPDKLAGVPVFPLPRSSDYEVSINWDSDQEVCPHTPRRRYVVGWVQKERKPGNDPGDDEDGYDGYR